MYIIFSDKFKRIDEKNDELERRGQKDDRLKIATEWIHFQK